MNSLEFINLEIATTKKHYKYHIRYGQTNYAIADEKRLQQLQQIKTELEAWYAIKPSITVEERFVNLYENNFKTIELKEGCIDALESNEDYEKVQKIIKALEVKDA